MLSIDLSALTGLETRLRGASHFHGVSSSTFYVRETDWPFDLRLAAMVDVDFPEPMHGLLSATQLEALVGDGSDLFVSSVEQTASSDLEGIPEHVRPLFGTFREREQVRSFARLVHTNAAGEAQAVLFVNYRLERDFDKDYKEALKNFLLEMVQQLPKIQANLKARDENWLACATQMTSTSLALSGTAFGTETASLEYFRRLLDSALATLAVRPGKGMGTLFLFEPERGQLKLAAKTGSVSEAPRLPIDVSRGEGIVSWVARLHRALLIEDLEHSKFRDIYKSLGPEVKSVLAVPLQSGEHDELIGVMCLESTTRKAFEIHHVRAAWHAARRAANTYVLHQQAWLSQSLLSLCASATRQSDTKSALAEVPNLALAYARASSCFIWFDDPENKSPLCLAAGTLQSTPPTGDEPLVSYVRDWKCPLWLSNITGPTSYSAASWHPSSWREGLPGQGRPALSRALRGEQAAHLIALPILARKKCVGVAVLRYARTTLEPNVGLLVGFADAAGLVYDSMELQQREDISTIGGHIAKGLAQRWRDVGSDLVELGVECRQLRPIGGDLYAAKTIDKNSTGILLLDGEGHGVLGGLNMLPMATAFEGCWDSHAPGHVIGQLIKTAEAIGVRGTGIYCILSQGDGKRWLTAVAAGRPGVRIIQREHTGGWSLADYPKLSCGMLGLPVSEPVRVAEPMEIRAGDIIIGYTDGIAAADQEVLPWQIDREIFAALSERVPSAQELAVVVMEAAERLRHGALTDDATVFVGIVK